MEAAWELWAFSVFKKPWFCSTSQESATLSHFSSVGKFHVPQSHWRVTQSIHVDMDVDSPRLLCALSPCPPAVQPEQEQTIAETLEFIGCLGSKLQLTFY